MTKKELINSIVVNAMCVGFPLSSMQISALNALTVKRIKAGMGLLCTGLADVVLDNSMSDNDIICAQTTINNARRSSL